MEMGRGQKSRRSRSAGVFVLSNIFIECQQAMKKLLTLCIICQPPKVLLGMKKRGFGAGRWNGFGGKVQEGEAVEGAARREVLEEAGLTTKNISEAGIINFDFQDGSSSVEVHVFTANEFEGEPMETEEMRPEWINADELPFDDMWPADRYWLPLVIQGKKIRGRFLYDKPSTQDYASVIIEKTLREVEEL